jgi:hypothetical protein
MQPPEAAAHVVAPASADAGEPGSLDDRLRLSIRGHACHVADLAMVAAAVLWLAVVLLATARRELVASDDAFISFHYARNLARGLGLVFNAGEHVWGFTSPLQTLLLGLLATLGCDTIRAAFVTGFLWVAVAAVLLYRVVAQWLSHGLALCLGLYFLLDAAQHGPYAMESGLLVALQLGFLLAVAAGRGRLANLLAALSCLARPDSLLLVLPILLAGRKTRRLAHLAWFVGPGLVWEAFAIFAYGALLPNSLAAKSGLSRFGEFFANAFRHVTSVTFTPGLGFPATASSLTSGLVVVLSVLPLLDARIRRRFAEVWTLVLYPWLLLAAYAGIGSFRNHNWELYSARFFLRVAAGVGVLTLAGLVARRLRLRPAWRWSALALALAFVIANGLLRTPGLIAEQTSANRSYYGGARYATYRQIADWVNHNLPQHETIAISEVGTFAYYTDMKVIDVSGIITRGYAPPERMQHAAFLRRFSPRYAILYGNRPDLRLGPTLHYRRLAYFAKQGFEDFSLLTRD